jgi:nitric oxide reductase subunit B
MDRPETPGAGPEGLSSWWRRTVLLVAIGGFGILSFVAGRAYIDAPPIPEGVVDRSGGTIFTGKDILEGQKVFLKHALMENGTIWGHGAYLGPDFSALYLHDLAVDAADSIARKRHGQDMADLGEAEQEGVRARVREMLKENRYDPGTKTLVLEGEEVDSFRKQVDRWAEHFSTPSRSGGLMTDPIRDPQEMRELTAFFAWTAWAAVANRPGMDHSYTNNFPYDPLAGNHPTSEAVLWSALSLIALLGGLAVVLFSFGRFNYLGWRHGAQNIRPAMVPGDATESQRALVKYFVIVSLLFLAQVLVGAAAAHNRAEPGTFFGFSLYELLPTNILRTWHLQLAIFWIATSYVAGGMLLGTALGEREPRGQKSWVHLLFWALVAVAGGSLLGELLGINQVFGSLWSWFGHQGWEYLDLGRAWQVAMVAGLVLWSVLLIRTVSPALKDPERREISWLFLIAALAIPFFYLPAFFFSSTTVYSVVDNWRFWIIHLWVEGFFELFVTTMVAVTFYRLGLVARITATRVVYLDAILFLGSGIVGTGHHWYWTGQGGLNMALSSLFSAMEVVPLTLLTLDAWDFVRLTRRQGEAEGRSHPIPHKWVFYFLMAVGFWNFVGAGIFGFLINLPIVSYYEIGTMLTPNHGHAAMMGVFGMEAVALMVLTFRQVLPDDLWQRPLKFIKVSFWGLNIGLALMLAGNLFPGGVMQLRDVLKNGYWHARSPEYMGRGIVRLVEWFRMPGDLVFILLGVVPLVIASVLTYLAVRGRRSAGESLATAGGV